MNDNRTRVHQEDDEEKMKNFLFVFSRKACSYFWIYLLAARPRELTKYHSQRDISTLLRFKFSPLSLSTALSELAQFEARLFCFQPTGFFCRSTIKPYVVVARCDHTFTWVNFKTKSWFMMRRKKSNEAFQKWMNNAGIVEAGNEIRAITFIKVLNNFSEVHKTA